MTAIADVLPPSPQSCSCQPCTSSLHATHKAGLNVRVADAGELRGIERGGSGQLPPAGPPSPGVPPLPNAPEVSSTTTSAQATKGSDDTRNPELFCMEDAEATVETLLLMEFADLGTLDQTVTSGKLRGDLVRALSCSDCPVAALCLNEVF